MGFRTVVLTNRCRVSYKSGHLVVRGDATNMVHLSEISMVILDTTAIYVSAYVLNQLAQEKIPVLICDEKHNPSGFYLPIYGAHNSSKRIAAQTKWNDELNALVWASVVRNKIENQARVLEAHSQDAAAMLLEYRNQVLPADKSNREGHAAKVYFNALFGKNFSRDLDCDINAALNYGYAILLSAFNKEIVSRGYLTQLGICHRNEYNQYNFGCDLMEPFRPVVDSYVASRPELMFNHETRMELIGLLDCYHEFKEGNYRLSSIISLYAQAILLLLDEECGCESSYPCFELVI